MKQIVWIGLAVLALAGCSQPPKKGSVHKDPMAPLPSDPIPNAPALGPGSKFVKADRTNAAIAPTAPKKNPDEWVGKLLPGLKDSRGRGEKGQASPMTPALAESLGGYRMDPPREGSMTMHITGVAVQGKASFKKGILILEPETVAGTPVKDIPAGSELASLGKPIGFVKRGESYFVDLPDGLKIRFDPPKPHQPKAP